MRRVLLWLSIKLLMIHIRTANHIVVLLVWIKALLSQDLNLIQGLLLSAGLHLLMTSLMVSILWIWIHKVLLSMRNLLLLQKFLLFQQLFLLLVEVRVYRLD